MNAAINHEGLRNRTPFNYPRSAHILLGYLLPYKSFSKRHIFVGWLENQSLIIKNISFSRSTTSSILGELLKTKEELLAEQERNRQTLRLTLRLLVQARGGE